jgi:predicted nucleic acid-binding protein
MFVLDTNVVSELMRQTPDSAVLAWTDSFPRIRLFITAITRAEIRYGIALLPVSRRQRDLTTQANRLFDEMFSDRILPFDAEAADVYSEIMTRRRRSGRPISQSDAQIASIARSRGARLATRDGAGFSGTGITVVNPWDAATSIG